MAILVAILCAVGGILLGGLIGFFARHLILAKQKRQAEAQAAALLTEAEGKQKALLLEAREEVHQIRRSAENEYKERRNEVRRQEKRLTQKEETLDRKVESVDRRLQNLSDKEEALDRKVAEAEELKELQLQKLETISSLTVEEARDRVIGEASRSRAGRDRPPHLRA